MSSPPTAVPLTALTDGRPLLDVANDVVTQGQAAIALWKSTKTYVEQVVKRLQDVGAPEERDDLDLLREITNVMDKAARTAALFARAGADLARLDQLLHGERTHEVPEEMTEAQLAERVLTMAKTIAIGPDGKCRVCGHRAVVTTTKAAPSESTVPEGW